MTIEELRKELEETRNHLEALVGIIDDEQPPISWMFVSILDNARNFLDPTNDYNGDGT